MYYEIYIWKVNKTQIAIFLNDVREQKKNEILKQLHIEDLENKNRNLSALLELNENMFQLLLLQQSKEEIQKLNTSK
jgi:hypothetical protein